MSLRCIEQVALAAHLSAPTSLRRIPMNSQIAVLLSMVMRKLKIVGFLASLDRSLFVDRRVIVPDQHGLASDGAFQLARGRWQLPS